MCKIVAAVALPGDGKTVIVEYGMPGYYDVQTRLTPEEFNAAKGITPEIAEAFLVGSMFGWDVPGAHLARKYVQDASYKQRKSERDMG